MSDYSDYSMTSRQDLAKSLIKITSINELTDVIIYDPKIVKRLRCDVEDKINKTGGITATFIARILYESPTFNRDIYRYRVTKLENIKIIKEGDGVWRVKITFDECCDEEVALARVTYHRNKHNIFYKNVAFDYFGNKISIGSKVVFIDRKVDGRNASANLAEGVVVGINKKFGQVYVDGYPIGFRSKNVIVFPEESKENPCI